MTRFFDEGRAMSEPKMFRDILSTDQVVFFDDGSDSGFLSWVCIGGEDISGETVELFATPYTEEWFSFGEVYGVPEYFIRHPNGTINFVSEFFRDDRMTKVVNSVAEIVGGAKILLERTGWNWFFRGVRITNDGKECILYRHERYRGNLDSNPGYGVVAIVSDGSIARLRDLFPGEVPDLDDPEDPESGDLLDYLNI